MNRNSYQLFDWAYCGLNGGWGMLQRFIPSIAKGTMNGQVGSGHPLMENLQEFDEGAAHKVLHWTTLLNAVNLNISRLEKVCADTHVSNREKRNGKGGQYWVNALGGMQQKVNSVNKCKKPATRAGFGAIR
ncbi:hypothetical protein [Limnobacter sp.]|jgi:hypothetical protein|uniref:hypothetical protein n=1 Tax=Limnobacter sp. TaxID=2003368 RepID=UPI002733A996|nr:hypothetical protein [Limnobacter sp.]MDP3272271.1 hypothetical protein [Limnobacter sp.]